MKKTTPKIKDTLKLLEKTGIFGKENVRRMFERTLGVQYNLEKEAVDEIVSLYMENDFFLEHAIDVANIYGKYFTHTEIKDLIDFYDSKLGKKVVNTSSQVADEVLGAGQEMAKATQGFMALKILKILEKHAR